MCGIVCALDINEKPEILRPQLLEMSKKLRHRGPDWSGIFSDENVVLAHERLAIVDPKSGKQPLYSKDGRYVLAANGEIYNHNGLKDITNSLNTSNFPRLRFGIGNNFKKKDQVDFVLSKWNNEETNNLENLINKNVEIIFSSIKQGLDFTMNKYN